MLVTGIFGQHSSRLSVAMITILGHGPLRSAPVSVQPTLVNAVNDTTSTTLTVSDAAGYAPANGYDPVIQIDNEQLLVTAVSGNTLTVKVRGCNQTLPASHNAGALILVADAPVLDPTTTTITVANAAALAASNASNFVIRIDQEQILVTGVNLSTGTLTVEPRHNGIGVSAHAAGV